MQHTETQEIDETTGMTQEELDAWADAEYARIAEEQWGELETSDWEIAGQFGY